MTERDDLEKAIAALEAQREALGDKTVDTLVAAARQKLAALEVANPSEIASPFVREEVSPIEERRKLVTMLFADVVGFTAMAEHMDAEDVRDTMNALWQRLDQTILRHGGQIDKHIGDAVMAVWGAQVAHEDDAVQAVRAALDMQATLGQTHVGGRSRSSRKGEPAEASQAASGKAGQAASGKAGQAASSEADLASLLSIRVVVHTGPVLLGKVGTTGEYTAIGDTVNVASRLQQAAPPGGIIISHDTYRQVHDQFDLLAQGPLVMKGKSEAIPVYRVQKAKARQFRMTLRGLKGLAIPIVGREVELQGLKDVLARMMERRSLEVVTIIGEAGVGKTRLLYEHERRLADIGQTFEMFRCRADAQMSSLPYALVRDLFANRFGILDSDRAATARRKLERGIGEYMGVDRPEVAHFIGHLIGFDFSASPYLRGILTDAKQIHARAFLSMGQFFTVAAQKAPLLIFVEDLHWADDRSLDLLSYLVHECQDCPILMVERPGDVFMSGAQTGQD
jgi:class 3 adenylate cyclase